MVCAAKLILLCATKSTPHGQAGSGEAGRRSLIAFELVDKSREQAKADLFVISGNQGAGKSIVGELLANGSPSLPHIDGDHVQRFVVSVHRWPQSLDDVDLATGQVVGEAGRQLRLRLYNGCLLAGSFVDAGITSILTDIIAGHRYEELVDHWAGRTIHFVMLRPAVHVLRRREAARGTGLNDLEDYIEESIAATPRRFRPDRRRGDHNGRRRGSDGRTLSRLEEPQNALVFGGSSHQAFVNPPTGG